MVDDFLRLNPNQMLLLSGLAVMGPSTTYEMYKRLKQESRLIQIASITMVYPILDSLIKKGLVEIASEEKRGDKVRKKYKVTGVAQGVLEDNRRAYQELAGGFAGGFALNGFAGA